MPRTSNGGLLRKMWLHKSSRGGSGSVVANWAASSISFLTSTSISYKRQRTQSVKQYWGICQKAVQSWCLSLFYLELLDAGHVVAEHAILQHGDGVTLTTNLLYLITCTIAEKRQIGAGVWQGRTNRILYYSWAQIQEWPLELVVGNVAPYWRLVKSHIQMKQDWF